ncbi:MAG: ATP-dependent zinc protease [Victivallales bacterium]|nr:ATP-dependent zinc protease [Victivallales bacterium]
MFKLFFLSVFAGVLCCAGCMIQSEPREVADTPVSVPAAMSAYENGEPQRDAAEDLMESSEDEMITSVPVVPAAQAQIAEVIPAQPESISSRELPGNGVKYPLGIIGEIEPVYVLPLEDAFAARIDTGATTSSIDAANIVEFERDGKSWVSFDVIHRESRKTYSYKKRMVKNINIVRGSENEERYVVKMDIKIGNQVLSRNFTLTDRSKFKFQVLIGRNVLSGLAVVDVNQKNTLE